MNFECVKCKEVVELGRLKTTNLKHPDEGELTWYYFECPKCFEQFSAFYKNDEVKALELEADKWEKRKKSPHLKAKAKHELAQVWDRRAVIMARLRAELDGGHVADDGAGAMAEQGTPGVPSEGAAP